MDDLERNINEYIELSDGTDSVRLRIIDTFGIEEKEYAALLDEEEEQLYILELEFEEDDVIFKAIEDEEELNDILDIYAELLDEEDEE